MRKSIYLPLLVTVWLLCSSSAMTTSSADHVFEATGYSEPAREGDPGIAYNMTQYYNTSIPLFNKTGTTYFDATVIENLFQLKNTSKGVLALTSANSTTQLYITQLTGENYSKTTTLLEFPQPLNDEIISRGVVTLDANSTHYFISSPTSIFVISLDGTEYSEVIYPLLPNDPWDIQIEDEVIHLFYQTTDEYQTYNPDIRQYSVYQFFTNGTLKELYTFESAGDTIGQYFGFQNDIVFFYQSTNDYEGMNATYVNGTQAFWINGSSHHEISRFREFIFTDDSIYMLAYWSDYNFQDGNNVHVYDYNGRFKSGITYAGTRMRETSLETPQQPITIQNLVNTGFGIHTGDSLLFPFLEYIIQYDVTMTHDIEVSFSNLDGFNDDPIKYDSDSDMVEFYVTYTLGFYTNFIWNGSTTLEFEDGTTDYLDTIFDSYLQGYYSRTNSVTLRLYSGPFLMWSLHLSVLLVDDSQSDPEEESPKTNNSSSAIEQPEYTPSDTDIAVAYLPSFVPGIALIAIVITRGRTLRKT